MEGVRVGQEQGQDPEAPAFLSLQSWAQRRKDAGNRDDDASIAEESDVDSLDSEEILKKCYSDSDLVGGVGQEQDQEQDERSEESGLVSGGGKATRRGRKRSSAGDRFYEDGSRAAKRRPDSPSHE
jgi:hypothetical protein